MKSSWLLGLVASCTLFWVVSGIAAKAPEPAYAGRPVREWLDGGYEQISMAMHETGPSAAPIVFSKLRRDHPVYGSWAKYRKLWRSIPGVLRRFMPVPKSASFDELTACNALLDIGPQVIPCLARGLEDHNEAVKLASVMALKHFCQRGSNITPAFLQLARATLDPNATVSQEAASALATLNTHGAATSAIMSRSS
jgi:hypothetical protein